MLAGSQGDSAYLNQARLRSEKEDNMIYRDFQGMKISNLGFGCMRLPVIGGDDAAIDEQQVFDMIEYAMEHGVNYYDTAWGYHSGNSERVVGRALARYPRESFYLADKFPGYDPSNFGKVEKIFAEQLRRCGMDYFDFYLAHNVCEVNIEHYLDDEKYGTMSYLKQQKKAGKIKHLGCSVHASFDAFKRFIDAYADCLEFCQIELNYLDYTYQDAKAKVDYLNQLNIPILVMEPIRGGKLAQIDDDYMARLDELRPGKTSVEWCLRYVQSFPEVFTVLSGMSNFEQVKQNIATFETDEPLTDDEMDVLYEVADRITDKMAVPCTACRYCVDHCPQGLDIPLLLDLYNQLVSGSSGDFIAPMRLSTLPKDEWPDACIACGSCVEVCPQAIQIPDHLEDFANRLG